MGSLELKVGVMVVVVSVLIGAMTLTVNEDPTYTGGAKNYWFKVPDASGLVERSAIKVAGISVGIVKKIRLEDGLARVELAFDPNIRITKTSSVEIISSGILGDKFVSVSQGLPTDPELPLGSEIVTVNDNGSMDKVVKQIGELADSLNDVARSIKDAVEGGSDSQNSPLGRTLKNIENLTADLAEISGNNKDKISTIVTEIQGVTGTLNEFINDDSDDGFKAAWRGAVASLHRIDKSLANIQDITDKINSGEGTLGRLVNDEETINELNATITGVNEFIGGANKLTTSIDVHAEYLNEQGLAKTYAGIRLQPGLDRYFEIAVVDDPKGVVEETESEKTVETNGDSNTTETTETITFKNKTKLTAIFAKNFWNFTLKGGLIENSGGLGFDYRMLNDKLRFSFEAFEFGGEAAHLRAYLRYSFIRGFYLIGGADDFASQSGTFSSFIGAGIDLSNDDIKKIATQVAF